jgi:hypothetical protein
MQWVLMVDEAAALMDAVAFEDGRGGGAGGRNGSG